MAAKRDVMDAYEYSVAVLGGTLVAVWFYWPVCYTVIPGFAPVRSRMVFLGLVFSLVLAGYLIVPRSRRTRLCAFININTPLAIYSILVYYTPLRGVINALLLGSALCLLVYAVFSGAICLSDIRTGVFRKHAKRFLKFFFHRSYMIVAGTLSAAYLVMVVYVIFGGTALNSSVTTETPKVNNETIAGNMDTVLLLQEDRWAELSAQEKLDVLQTVANIEATYLGIPHELHVKTDMLGEWVLGCYADDSHTIFVNAEMYLEESAHEMVRVISHEAYHAYEYRLVDLYQGASDSLRNLRLFNRISKYEYEFNNYIDGELDAVGYALQLVEIDSDAYAASAVDDYYEAIAEHLNSETTSGQE